MALTTLSKRWSPSFFWADQHADDNPQTLSRRWDVDLFWGSPLEQDVTPPSIAANVAAGVITHDEVITVSCSDVGGTFDKTGGVAHFTIWIEHADGTEMVFDGLDDAVFDYGAPYDAAGSVTPSGNGIAVVCDRDDGERAGWPWSAFTLHARAVDQTGNAVSFSRAYTVSPNYQSAIVFAYLPAAASSIDFDDTIRVTATETAPDSIAWIRIWVSYNGTSQNELIYDDSPGENGAQPGFTIVEAYPTNARQLTISRDVEGWLGTTTTIHVVVRTKNIIQPEQESTAFFTVAIAPVDVGDETAPTAGNVTPTPGTPITAETPVSVDVTDETGLLRRVLLAVELEGLTELAWDGDDWLGYYAGGGCAVQAISGGFRFTVLRDGGWPSSPRLRVWAFDEGGNEV